MDKKELNQESHFDEFAYDWWNKSGHYKLLHRLNPIRLEYILSRCSLDKKNVLDIGCGGGILSEELCKQGAKVTGIDSSSKSISIAKQHAKQNNYDIKYTLGVIRVLKDSDGRRQGTLPVGWNNIDFNTLKNEIAKMTDDHFIHYFSIIINEK